MMDYLAPDSKWRYFTRVVAGLNLCVAALATVILLWNLYDPFLALDAGASPLGASAAQRFAETIPWIMATLATLNMISISYRVYRYHRSRTDRMLRYDKQGGTVSLSIRALEETITASITALGEIASARVRMHTISERGPIAIHVDYWAVERTNVVLGEQRLREAVKFRFSELVGPEAELKATFFVRLRGFRRPPPEPALSAEDSRRKDSRSPDQVFAGRPRYSPEDYIQ